MVLGTLINHPELLSRDTLYELRNIVARYPYFQAARLLMLNNMYLLHDPNFGAELRRSVLYVSDRRALCRLIEGYVDRVLPDELETLAEEPSVDRTMSLIDAFLGTLPKEAGDVSLVPDTVGDYAASFLVDEETSASSLETSDGIAFSADDSLLRALALMSQQQMPDAASRPLSSTPSSESSPNVVTSQRIITDSAAIDDESLDESYFTETLAKIYIKQHKYSRALEIIQSLYLQFPEKNAYFADQIRFLEKLIINNNLK